MFNLRYALNDYGRHRRHAWDTNSAHTWIFTWQVGTGHTLAQNESASQRRLNQWVLDRAGIRSKNWIRIFGRGSIIFEYDNSFGILLALFESPPRTAAGFWLPCPSLEPEPELFESLKFFEYSCCIGLNHLKAISLTVGLQGYKCTTPIRTLNEYDTKLKESLNEQ